MTRTAFNFFASSIYTDNHGYTKNKIKQVKQGDGDVVIKGLDLTKLFKSSIDSLCLIICCKSMVVVVLRLRAMCVVVDDKNQIH